MIADLITANRSCRRFLVLALGKPKEEIVVEMLKEDGDICYWRDIEMVHHVPKRSVEEIIVDSF